MSEQENFRQTEQFLKVMMETLTKWLKALGEYLEFRGETSAQRELGRWLSKNGGDIYQIKGNCAEELKQSLTERGIGFIPDVSDNHNLIIRDIDKQRIHDINKDILIARSNYFQEIDTSALENAVASVDKITDKNIITLHNLSSYQVEVLKNKCNDITHGFMVGIGNGEKPGRYNLSVSAPKVFNRSQEKDLCKAYLDMAFSLYGANSAIKQKQIDADKAFEKKIASIKGVNRSYYIVGADDIQKYIELNGNGFEYYERQKDPSGEICDIEVKRCDIFDDNFDMELQICMDKLKNKTILTSVDELSKHLNNPKRNVNFDRPERTRKENEIAFSEHSVVNMIDRLVRKNIYSRQDNINPDDAFRLYMNEADDIVNALVTNSPARNYSDLQMADIRSYCDNAPIDISRYKNVKSVLTNYALEKHKAQIKEIQKEKEPVNIVKEHQQNRERGRHDIQDR